MAQTPNRVHFDHNSTTPLRPEVAEMYGELLQRNLGNPSSVHATGRLARQVLDEARDRTAAALGVQPDEIVFTGGGTEANNLALFGSLLPGDTLATTTVEHSSVFAAARQLEQRGHPVHWIGVDAHGFPKEQDLLSLPERCALVSVMSANNEIGSLPDVEGLVQRLAGRTSGARPRVHTDAVQALGKVCVNLAALDVDLASFSLHKVGGPRGVGVLYQRSRTRLTPIQFGGEQEGGLRPGTEDVASIAAGALALELALDEQEDYERRVGALCQSFWRQLHDEVPTCKLVGPPIDDPRRLPNTLNVILEGIESRVLVTKLDLQGLEASAGSACSSGSLEPSHVLRALGYTEEQARAGLRLSLGRTTTREDVDKAVEILRITCRQAGASCSNTEA